MEGELRLKLEGKLGGAMYLRTMAEMIRRAAERTFDTELPEEDEMGFGWTRKGYKEHFYGTARILDSSIATKKEYLRALHLKADTKINWYVEGTTEYYAILSVKDDFGLDDMVVYNLFGQIIGGGHKGGNAIAFRDNLRNDRKARIFSFVMVDGDVPRNVTTVKKSAEDGEFCGAFFVSEPDFEFCNFDLSELQEVLWMICLNEGVPENIKFEIENETKDTTNGEEFIQRANKVVKQFIPDLAKGEEWGKQLMLYAANKPYRSDGRPRLVLEAIRLSFMMRNQPYTLHERNHKVDKESGLPVPIELEREQTRLYLQKHYPWYYQVVDRRPRMLRKQQ